jgi:hypothetical protein
MREKAKCSSVSRFTGVVAEEMAGYLYMMPKKQLRVSRLLFLFFLTHNSLFLILDPQKMEFLSC